MYQRAKTLILQGTISDSIPWCRLCRSSDEPAILRVNETIGTLIRFHQFPIWTVNPCRVVDVRVSEKPLLRRVGVKYATLQGHFLQGEESYSVYTKASINAPNADHVFMEMITLSKPSGMISAVCLPWIRSLQNKFLYAHVSAVQNTVNSSNH